MKGQINPSNMKQGQIKDLLLFGFFVLLAISALVLASQQNVWLKQAGENQLASSQKEMAFAVTEALDATREQLETSLLQALSEAKPNELVNGLWQVSEQASPTLVFGDSNQFNWSQANLTWQLNSKRPSGYHLLMSQEGHYGIFLRQVKAGSSNQSRSAFLLEINLDYLLANIIKPNLDTLKPDYETEIWVDGARSTTNANLSAYAAEFSIPLDLIDLTLVQATVDGYRFLPSRYRPHPESTSNQNQSRDVFRLYENILRDLTRSTTTEPDQQGIQIVLYTQGQNLASAVSRHYLYNRLFSWGVIIVLVATAVILILSSRRIRAQHQREQEFVATVSHELRTPLTVIRSAADNMQAGVVTTPESVMRYGEEINRQSQRLDRMIESTLFYSRLESQTQINVQTINTEPFFNDLLQPLSQLAKDHQVRLHTELNSTVDQIHTDANGLRLIINNLFMNAIVHGQPDAQEAQIWLTINCDDKHIKIAIADNGPGIPKAEQKKVFKPFVRGQLSAQKQHPGTGLGLNLIQRMVEKLDGEINLASPYTTPLQTEQQGAQFTITLPMQGSSHD